MNTSSILSEVNAFLDHTITTATEARQALKFLSSKKESLTELANHCVDTLQSNKPEQNALIETQNMMEEVLVDEGLKATSIAEEFNVDAYAPGWVEVLQNPKSFLLSITGGNKLRIENNFDNTAGTIEEYAHIVQEVRDSLGTLIDPNGVDQDATWNDVSNPSYWHAYFWEEKFYKPAREGDVSSKIDQDYLQSYIEKYWKTMEWRASKFTKDKPAPYWRLVDEGFRAYAYGRDTSAYPTTQPTNFIDLAMGRLQEIYTKSYETSYKNFDKVSKDYNEVLDAIGYINEKIQSVEEFLNLSSGAGANIVGYQYDLPLVKQELDTRFSGADESRLQKLLDMIDSGQVPTTKSGRVELGKHPETGKRWAPRTKRLFSELEKYRKGVI